MAVLPVLDSIPAMAIRLDRGLVCRYANLRYALFCGLAPEQLRGMALPALLPAGSDLAAVGSQLQQVLHGAELTFLTAGAEPLLEITAAPERNACGAIDGCTLLLHDVSARIRLAQLRDAEHAVSRALSAAGHEAAAIACVLSIFGERLHWDWGACWRHEAHSRLLERLACWQPPDAAPLQIAQQRILVLPPETDAMTRALRLRRPVWTGTLPPFAAGRGGLAGSEGLCEMLLVPVIAGDACFGVLEFFGRSRRVDDAALLTTARAIGEQLGLALRRCIAEKHRLAAAEQLSTLFDNVPGAVFRLHLAADGAYRFSYISEHLHKLCGVSAAAALNDPASLHELICPEHRRHLRRALQLSREQGSEWDCEFEIRPATARRAWVRLRARPQQHGEGSVVWDGVLTDVTDRKRAELDLVELNLDLEQRITERTKDYRQAINELGAFAYSVSHDLRAPLRAINGFTRIVLNEHGSEFSPVVRDYLQRVDAASSRMGELIDALLALSRMSRQDLALGHVDLSLMAQSVADELARTQPRSGVSLSVQPGLHCTADGRMMRILLENLLGNAWKFSRKRAAAVIEFGALPRDNELVYHVRDNGAGFDRQYAERLFEPFRRLHETSEFEGTGIGLATVQRIVHRHGGRIWAESAPERGATFFFTLATPRNAP